MPGRAGCTQGVPRVHQRCTLGTPWVHPSPSWHATAAPAGPLEWSRGALVSGLRPQRLYDSHGQDGSKAPVLSAPMRPLHSSSSRTLISVLSSSSFADTSVFTHGDSADPQADPLRYQWVTPQTSSHVCVPDKSEGPCPALLIS